jgi:hypothetical protein
LYVDEVWRVTVTQTAGVYTHISSQGSYRHEVDADRIIWEWEGSPGRWHDDYYVLHYYSIPVYFCSKSPDNHSDDCDEISWAHFVRECRWG